MREATEFGRYLSAYVGRTDRMFTVQMMASLPGAPDARTINSHRDGSTLPPLPALTFYGRHLPAVFLADVLRPAGVSAVLKCSDVTADGNATMVDLTAKTHALAQALGDGRIDHVEALRLSPLMRDLGQRLICFADGLDVRGQG